jgi:ketosteroid isomerase-like protein
VSQENVEIARALIDAFNREGVAATAPFVARDLEVHPFPEWPGSELYRGLEGFTELADEWTENFNGYAWDVQRVIAAGERVVILANHSGRTKDQGVPIHQPVGAVYWLRRGRVARMAYFLTWGEALEAGGLRE